MIVWGIDSTSNFEIHISAVISVIYTYSAYYTPIFIYRLVKTNTSFCLVFSKS